MFVFIIIIAVIFSLIKDKKLNSWMVVLSGITMILICGFRGEDVGADTYNYVLEYQGNGIDKSEFLFLLIIRIFNYFSLSFSSFFIFISFLTIAPIIYVAKKQINNPNIVLLIYITLSVYFYFNTFNVIRMELAMSYFFLSVFFFNQKKYYKSVLSIVIACLFHYSAIVVIPLFILACILNYVSEKVIKILIIISFILGLSTSVIPHIDIYIQQISMFLSLNDTSSHYAYYFDDLSLSYEGSSRLIGRIINYLPFTLIGIFSKKTDYNKYYYSLFFLGIFLGNIFMEIKYAYRIVSYLTLFSILLIPITLQEKSNIKNYIVNVGVIIFSVLYTFNNIYKGYLFEYHSIFYN